MGRTILESSGSSTNLWGLLERARSQAPDRTCIRAGGRSIRYAELTGCAERMAGALRARGVQSGDRVLLACRNSTNGIAMLFAIWHAGAVVSWLAPSTPLHKRERIACRLQARLVILDDDLADYACHPAPEGPPVSTTADQLAAVLFTSGSEGEPKGVMLRHVAMQAAVASIQAYLDYRPTDVVALGLPLHFDYGLYQVLLCMNVAGCLWMPMDLDFPARWLPKCCGETTILPLMPSLVAILRSTGIVGAGSIRMLTSTGATLPPSMIEWLMQNFADAVLFSMYGLTECKRVSYLPPELLPLKPHSVGLAIPGTRIAVVDSEGLPCAPGVVGEVIVKGPTLMDGYWQDPQSTARALRIHANERALYSGDRAWLDADGHLYLAGRSDDIIKSRGMKVAPREVEAGLMRIDGVIEAAVIGVDDPMQGQAIAAWVVLSPGCRLTPTAVRRACREYLEELLVPKHLRIVEELPRSANGKVDRARLG